MALQREREASGKQHIYVYVLLLILLLSPQRRRTNKWDRFTRGPSLLPVMQYVPSVVRSLMMITGRPRATPQASVSVYQVQYNNNKSIPQVTNEWKVVALSSQPHHES